MKWELMYQSSAVTDSILRLVKLAGNKNLNDVFFTTAYTTVDASDALTQFIADYKKEYNEDPLFHAITPANYPTARRISFVCFC